MTNEEILKVIADNFLCVRRLPFEVITHWSYCEGDETKKYVDSKGNPSKSTREVVVQQLDLEYFKNTKPSKWCTDSPEKRFETWKKNFPNGRKLTKETRPVEKGGWWYVKQVKNTSSTVKFDREYDEYFAPTLGEAIELYLKANGKSLQKYYALFDTDTKCYLHSGKNSESLSDLADEYVQYRSAEGNTERLWMAIAKDGIESVAAGDGFIVEEQNEKFD